MKKQMLLLTLIFIATQSWSQQEPISSSDNITVENRNFHIPLIGDVAPSFTSQSTKGIINFPKDFGRSWKILFSHPQDFTPVCSTEILELAYSNIEFEKLGVKLVVVSTDSLITHKMWKKAMEEIPFRGKGMVKIQFPLVADANLSISKKYGMIFPASNTTKAVRGVFIIDPDNVIQLVYFYPTNIGRSTDELIRVIKALQTSASENVLTPANWKEGDDYLVSYLPPKNPKYPDALPNGFYSTSWFLNYKKANLVKK